MIEQGVLYRRALEEASITEQVRRTSRILRAVGCLETLVRFPLKNQGTALASFCAMGIVALLPEAITLLNGLTLVDIDASLVSALSSQVLPSVTGVAIGDYWRPASTIVDKARETRVLEGLKEPMGRGRVLGRSLGLLCADYPDVIPPNDINDYLRRGRSRTEYQKDPRLEAIGLIHRSLHPEKPEEAPRTLRQKRRQEREEREETVIFSLKSQIMGQRIRRLDSHIRTQVLKKIADWGLGAAGGLSLAVLVNSQSKSASAAGLTGLIDDAFALGSLFLSPAIKRLFQLFGEERKEDYNLQTTKVGGLPSRHIKTDHQMPVGHVNHQTQRRF